MNRNVVSFNTISDAKPVRRSRWMVSGCVTLDALTEKTVAASNLALLGAVTMNVGSVLPSLKVHHSVDEDFFFKGTSHTYETV